MRKVIWITGASSGFGFSAAQDLLRYTNHIVCVSARRADRLNILETDGAVVYPLDVRYETEVEDTAAQIVKDYGTIDAVLVNAGFGVYGTVEDVPGSAVKTQFDVNVFGLVETIKSVLPVMRKNRAGRIVITSSTAAHVSTKGMGYYSATKHAVRAIGTALRQEVKDFGIDVVMIEPGIVKTDFKENALNNSYIDDENSPYYPMMGEIKSYMLDAFERAPGMTVVKDIMLYALLSDKVKPVYRTDAKSMLQNHLIHLVPQKIYDKIISSIIKR